MMVKSSRVYHVTPEDTINKILRMLPKMKAKRFVLVIPQNVALLQHEVNLRLLTAYAEDVGIELAVVSEDKLTRRRAAQYGIRIFESAEGPIKKRKHTAPAEKTPPQAKGKLTKKEKQKRTIARPIVLFACVIAVIVTVYAFVPRFHVWIELQYEEIQFAKQVNLTALGLHPVIAEEHINIEHSVPVTGTKRVGVEKAQGVVVLLNAGADDALIPAGTVFATESGIQFAANDDIIVPGREMRFYLDVPAGIQSGRAEAYVTAVRAGSEGNVAAESVRVIDGQWEHITVRNPTDMEGGKDREVTVVTEEDIEEAEHAVQRKVLAQHAQRKQTYEDENEHIAVLGTAWVKETNVTFSHHPDDVSETLHVTATHQFNLVGIPKEEISDFVTKTISNDIPFGYTWDETLGITTNVTSIDDNNGTIEVVGNIRVQPVVDFSQLTRMIAGHQVQEAVAVLEETEGVQKAGVEDETLRVLPKWAPWIRVTTKQ